MEYEIKYDDGTREMVNAAKYDERGGVFIDVTGQTIAHVNLSKTKLVRVVIPEKVEGA